MKRRRFLGLMRAGVTLALAVCALSISFGDEKPRGRNPRVTGTYIAAFGPHSFDPFFTPPSNAIDPTGIRIDVGGGLFSFFVTYDTQGFYQASSGQGVLFINGQKRNLTISMVSNPFPAPGESEYDLTYHLTASLSGVNGLIVGGVAISAFTGDAQTWYCDGLLNFGNSRNGSYFTDRVQYQGEPPVLAYLGFVPKRASTTGQTEWSGDAEVPFIEAKKISDQFVARAGAASRVRVRR